MKLARKILSILIRDRIQYPGRLILDTVIIVARCGVLLIIYWYVFNLNGGAVNGTEYIFVAWSIFFYFAFSTLRLRDISRLIMQDVQSGNVEVLFSKPVSYLSYRFWWQIGSGLYSFLVATVVGTLILSLAVGFPATMKLVIFIPTLAMTFLGAMLLSLILYTIVGLMAFWIEDINPLFWIIDKSVMILGGSYLPIALFPPIMYKLSLYSPFGASQFITHTVYGSWSGNWYRLLSIQWFWIAVLLSGMIFIFSRAKEKVSINGG